MGCKGVYITRTYKHDEFGSTNEAVLVRIQFFCFEHKLENHHKFLSENGHFLARKGSYSTVTLHRRVNITLSVKRLSIYLSLIFTLFRFSVQSIARGAT